MRLILSECYIIASRTTEIFEASSWFIQWFGLVGADGSMGIGNKKSFSNCFPCNYISGDGCENSRLDLV